MSRLDSAEISLEQYKQTSKVNIDSEVFCTCSPSNRAVRKICPHIIWIYINLFHLDESDPTLAQISFSSLEISNLISLCPDDFPENLLSCIENNIRKHQTRLKENARFDENAVQDWFVGVKRNNTPARCSGCLIKGAIKQNDVHVYCHGLLYLSGDKVVETKLRFCAKKTCLTNIKGALHNFKGMPEAMILTRKADLQISQEQGQKLISDGFVLM